MSDGADYLFVTTDPLGNRVCLTPTCYYGHVIVEHPDLQDVDENERTVRQPDIIALDAIDTERIIYYRSYQRRPQRRLIKVVVEREEVVTAYRVKRMKEGERILWQR